MSYSERLVISVKNVEPIRDKKAIEAMKRILLGNKFGLRDHALFVLGINSGLRVSDLLELKINDVVDVKGKIKDRIALREKKTRKNKDFPISVTAGKALKEYLDTRKNADQEEPLFLSRNHKALGRQQAWIILSSAAKLAGIKENVGTHTLRKTFGYHAYADGKDIALVQTLLNHSHPAVTLRYIGITKEQTDRVYLSLNL